MSTEPQPSIADLWGEFQTRHLSDAERLQWDHMRENGQISEEKYQDHLTYIDSLRAQLLEETKPYFKIIGDKSEAGSELKGYFTSWKIPTNRLKEIGAAANFVAWEIEQRQREGTTT